uniref:Uncharacterized protein n=1 Tax=Grammatophora oceanica TaxID=210454 RepID=A0A7S1V6C0_9STRA|mmetsp:Transcript_37926/g.56370  ORF Transcript_37926/g.56370 Transcript_37926/m.56370 type:complete len:470 (+) Transcript_37926:21-1430(+)
MSNRNHQPPWSNNRDRTPFSSFLQGGSTSSISEDDRKLPANEGLAARASADGKMTGYRVGASNQDRDQRGGGGGFLNKFFGRQQSDSQSDASSSHHRRVDKSIPDDGTLPTEATTHSGNRGIPPHLLSCNPTRQGSAGSSGKSGISDLYSSSASATVDTSNDKFAQEQEDLLAKIMTQQREAQSVRSAPTNPRLHQKLPSRTYSGGGGAKSVRTAPSALIRSAASKKGGGGARSLYGPRSSSAGEKSTGLHSGSTGSDMNAHDPFRSVVGRRQLPAKKPPSSNRPKGESPFAARHTIPNTDNMSVDSRSLDIPKNVVVDPSNPTPAQAVSSAAAAPAGTPRINPQTGLVEMYPGTYVHIHSTRKALDAIALGTATIVRCSVCNKRFQIAQTAKVLYCTSCKSLTPVDPSKRAAAAATAPSPIDKAMQEDQEQIDQDRKLAKRLQDGETNAMDFEYFTAEKKQRKDAMDG